MIIKASQRGSGGQLARHLLNSRDNDHVTVHELRGFMADNVKDAFHEAFAVSLGSRCQQYLFSLSLNPPSEADVPVATFEEALDKIEAKLGLTGQPRAVIFHEKNGRCHAHCVWSRVRSDSMTAINLSHYKRRLQDISRSLYQEHDWPMPEGLIRSEDRDPLSYQQVEHQQAKRVHRDPRAIKQLFQQCWAVSDTQSAFAAALAEHGYILAKGDRRGHVAVDANGEVYSVARWVGIKTKEVRAKLGRPHDLPSVEEAIAGFDLDAQSLAASPPTDNQQTNRTAFDLYDDPAFQAARTKLVSRQRDERQAREKTIETRRIAEAKKRSRRLPTGLKALWAKMNGTYQSLCAALEKEADAAQMRDDTERQALIRKHLTERQKLQIRQLAGERSSIEAQLQDLFASAVRRQEFGKPYLPSDLRQALVLSEADDEIYSASEIAEKPFRILEVITDKEMSFTRNDIVRGLSKAIDDPVALRSAIDRVMTSPELVSIPSDNETQHYSTKEMVALKGFIEQAAVKMPEQSHGEVSQRFVDAAIHRQNRQLKRSVGASLSDEQITAIRHILKADQLSAVIGLAGTGKSTLLSAARDAWTRQGYRVLGASLSGKAATGMQAASGIPSRTLASWEKGWEHGTSQIMRGDVFVIDEAGMVGSRQMKRFMDQIIKAGAKLVLIGDPAQLQPINAGTPFKDITDTIPTAKLTEIRRQKEDWQRQATLDLAEGRTEKALEDYAKRGFVYDAPSTEHAIAKLVEDYMVDWELRGAEASRLALAYRRRDVHALNQAIRLARKAAGDLTDEIIMETDRGPRAIAEGDRILFTAKNRDHNIENGMLATVTGMNAERIEVTLDGEKPESNRERSFSPKELSGIDHGYATTIHKSQGMTVDNAFVLADHKQNRHLQYVAMSRHRLTLRPYCSRYEI